MQLPDYVRTLGPAGRGYRQLLSTRFENIVASLLENAKNTLYTQFKTSSASSSRVPSGPSPPLTGKPKGTPGSSEA